jgi:S-adenosylmethionine:tRNA ribosyltransferase-isomerase
MRVDAFDYDLPPELIAQRPCAEREAARLMHLTPARTTERRAVGELPELLPPGSLVVVNDTRVIPARLLGRKKNTGGSVEIFLVRRVADCTIEAASGPSGAAHPAQTWRALGKANKSLKFESDVEIAAREGSGTALLARLLRRADDGLLEVALWSPTGEPIDAALRACGHVPLPPYIKRDDEAADLDRYQTVYARHDGAVAAPTAGLHVTEGLLERLATRGCEVAQVTLHVGLGTFQPVQADDLDAHPMHSEAFVVEPACVDAIGRARDRGQPVVAVGTTTARALESAADPAAPGRVRAAREETRLLIQPGYRWKVVDGLLTNFHLPRSTLLALVCALGGRERVLDAYALAVRERYRFYSYGDAMLLWGKA